jgi:hypothetical protein
VTHLPIQVQGKSRIDTWQNKKFSTSKTRSQQKVCFISLNFLLINLFHLKVFNQPVQVTGKSRLDTWQKESFYQKRRRSPSPVRILHSYHKLFSN